MLELTFGGPSKPVAVRFTYRLKQKEDNAEFIRVLVSRSRGRHGSTTRKGTATGSRSSEIVSRYFPERIPGRSVAKARHLDRRRGWREGAARDGRAECFGVAAREAKRRESTWLRRTRVYALPSRTRRRVGARKVYTGAVRCGW